MLTEVLLTIWLSMISLGVLFWMFGCLIHDYKVSYFLYNLGLKMITAWIIITILCVFGYLIYQVWNGGGE